MSTGRSCDFSTDAPLIRHGLRLLLLAVFGSLRWGELAALRLADVDPSAQTVRISRQLVDLHGGGFGFPPSKSDAGKRMVVIPAAIMPIVREHVERMTMRMRTG